MLTSRIVSDAGSEPGRRRRPRTTSVTSRAGPPRRSRSKFRVISRRLSDGDENPSYTPNEPNRPAASRSKAKPKAGAADSKSASARPKGVAAKPTANAKPKAAPASKADSAAKSKSKPAKTTKAGSDASKTRKAAASKTTKPKATKSAARQSEATAFENHVVKTLFDSLEAHVAAHELGHVVGPKQFDLGPDDESAGRLPDIAFVSFDRWAQYRRVPTHDRWHVAPDLLVQIVRKGELAENFTTQLDACFEAGVRRVWMLFPDKGEARVYESAADVHTLGDGQSIEGGDVLPGFEHSLVLLFHEPKDPS